MKVNYIGITDCSNIRLALVEYDESKEEEKIKKVIEKVERLKAELTEYFLKNEPCYKVYIMKMI